MNNNNDNLSRQILNRTCFKDSRNAINEPQTIENFLNDSGNKMEKDKEIETLKKKIAELSETIQYLEKESDVKERAIGTLARDKEHLASELKKERRSTTKLRQQLEDERNFYLQEKQNYCQEMNDIKRNKRKQLINNINEENLNIENLNNEVLKLKTSLEEAAQTNYNLCVKFLRMKAAKDDLKNRFQRYQIDQTKVLEDLTAKLNDAKDELKTVINEQFQKSLSLSNKKFLEIVKRNSQLMHENLCLKVQIEHLITEIEDLQTTRIKLETKQKYPFLVKTSKHNFENITTAESGRNKNSCRDFIVPLLKLYGSSKTTLNKTESEPSKISIPKQSLFLEGTKYKLELKSKNSNLIKSSVSTTSSYVESIRTQSAPALLLLRDFKQISSSATQTSLQYKTTTYINN